MRVSVKELLRNFSLLSDKALHEPLIITKNGRDRLVLVSIDEYNLMRDMIGRASRDEQIDLVDKPKSA
jgi:prevent-host-death family protein